jgi:hypothetical protein
VPTFRRTFGLLAGLLLGCSAAPASAVTPIPQDAGELAQLQPFTGSAAVPRPVQAPAVPRHPFMAANGRSNVHNNAYQTDSYPWSGPLGRNPRVFSQHLGTIGSCGITIAFDRRGRLVTICISGTAVRLTLLDPQTLETLATHDLPPRVIPPGRSPFTTSGGAYFYLDHRDRAVVAVRRRIHVIALRGASGNLRWVRERTYDVGRFVPSDDQLNSAIPDWKGRLWFVSRTHGIVGVLDPDTGRLLGSRRTGEPIGNSFAVDETGGVFVVTDGAMYRFDATRGGAPRVSWRVRYRNTGVVKPGQFDPGSGTTPTLMGSRYVSIADNADPMNVVVYRRARRLSRGGRLVCEHPVFRKGAGATDNSLIGTGRSMIVENNYGYAPPPEATDMGRTTAPGIERVDIDRDGRGCHTVWKSPEISPSTVPKLSLANGLVYAYTKPAGTPDAWYLTALSYHTGRTVWRRLTGTGLFFNVHYAGLAISPAGVLYSGVLGGTVAVADG